MYILGVKFIIFLKAIEYLSKLAEIYSFIKQLVCKYIHPMQLVTSGDTREHLHDYLKGALLCSCICYLENVVDILES